MYEIAIANRLQDARKKAGLTQTEVLEPLDIASVQSLSAYENGKTAPPLDKLKAMAALYNVSTDWLLFGQYVPTGPKTRNDYLLQLVDAVDTLGLTIESSEAVPHYGTSGEKYLVRLIDTTDYACLLPPLFITRWRKFRDLLDNKDIDQWAYNSLMAKLKEELLAGSLEDEIPPFPF